MTDTFAPSINPGVEGTGMEADPNVLEAKFGDGYRQDTPEGLNAGDGEIWTLVWPLLTPEQAAEIETGLRTNMKVRRFYWTPPDRSQAKYRCTAFRLRPTLSGLEYSITATLERVFDL